MRRPQLEAFETAVTLKKEMEAWHTNSPSLGLLLQLLRRRPVFATTQDLGASGYSPDGVLPVFLSLLHWHD